MTDDDVNALEEIAAQTDFRGNTKSPRGCKRSRTCHTMIPTKIIRLFGRAKGRKQKVTLPVPMPNPPEAT